jgi:hypothetical protein
MCKHTELLMYLLNYLNLLRGMVKLRSKLVIENQDKIDNLKIMISCENLKTIY